MLIDFNLALNLFTIKMYKKLIDKSVELFHPAVRTCTCLFNESLYLWWYTLYDQRILTLLFTHVIWCVYNVHSIVQQYNEHNLYVNVNEHDSAYLFELLLFSRKSYKKSVPPIVIFLENSRCGMKRIKRQQ